VKQAQGNAGAEWIDRYLMPQITNSGLAGLSSLRCLQFGPDDDEEAQRLRERGHHCMVHLTALEPYRRWHWHQSPVVADWRTPALRSGSFDLIFTGWFGRLASNSEELPEVAKFLTGCLRPGGAMLLSVSNRWCPVDLIDKRLRAPGSGQPGRLSLDDIEQAFDGLGVTVELRNVQGHFRWGRLPALLQWLGPLLNLWLGLTSIPRLRWLYVSPLNPMLMLWVVRR
jgi:hypothetical protein